MTSRREMLKRSATVMSLMAAAGVLPQMALAAEYNKSAFEAKTVADLAKALGKNAPTESAEITVQGPDIAENGAVVPLGASTSMAGVKKLMLLVEKNPNVLAGMFELTDAVPPAISTRVKMGQSSNVYAVAEMNDGRLLYAMKEVKVTLGGCGG